MEEDNVRIRMCVYIYTRVYTYKIVACIYPREGHLAVQQRLTHKPTIIKN